jgi:hypothetical protein
MKISDIVSLAKYSELNTLAVKDNVPAIVSFINLGLLELYSQFNLYSEEYMIALVDGQTIYDLPENFMYMTGAFEAPPEGSCQNSLPLPINEENNPLSLNTINYRQVQIPLSTGGAYISVIYTPKPETFTIEDLDEEVPLPDNLIQPLLNFIAYKGHGAIRVEGQGDSDIYFARFRRSCEERKTQGTSMTSDDLSMASRIYSRGFP